MAKKGAIYVLVALLLVSTVFAATVSHNASQIRPGIIGENFAPGDWILNGNFTSLNITNNITAANVITNVIQANAIVGDGSQLTGIVSAWNLSGSNVYQKDLNYNVGIGTKTPSAKLDVAGDVYIQGVSPMFAALGTGGGGTVVLASTNTMSRVGTASSHPFSVVVGNDPKIYINTFGDVNIGPGITNPGAKLDVKGNVSLNNTLFVNSAGKVGIGTASPTTALSVVGDINTTGNVIVGNNVILNNGGLSGVNSFTAITIAPGTLSGMLLLRGGTTSGSVRITDSGNNALLLADMATQRVGIGTGNAIPTQTLTVAGDLNVTGTSYLGNIQIAADEITTNSVKSRTGDITFKNSTGSEMARIMDNGRIGIGTASPSSKLDVVGDFEVDTNDFFVNATSGNTGIGTNNPTSKLDVAGNLKLSTVFGSLTSSSQNFVINTNTSTNSIQGRISFLTTGFRVGNNLDTADGANTDFVIEGAENSNDNNVKIASLSFSNDANNAGQTQNPIAQIGSAMDNLQGANRGDLRFYTKDGTTLTQRMHIDDDGFIGINTTDPTSTLTVKGDLNVTGTSYLGNIQIAADEITTNSVKSRTGDITFKNSTGSEMARIMDNGKIGIGTASPLTDLDFNNKIRMETSFGQTQTLPTDSSSQMNIGNLGFMSNWATIMMNTFFNGTVYKYVSSDSAFTIQHNENEDTLKFLYSPVGVAGNTVNAFGNGIVLNTEGKVGINTTTPTNTLTVVGDLNVTGQIIGQGVGGGSASGETLVRTINQSGQSFTVGTAVTYNGSHYVKAIANNESLLGLFVVSQLVDSDMVKIVQAGWIDNLTGMTAGQYYYVSDVTAGLLTTTDGMNYSNPIFLAVNSTAGYVLPWRPSTSGTAVNDLWINSSNNLVANLGMNNVGIGTGSPGYKLHISGTQDNLLYIENSSSVKAIAIAAANTFTKIQSYGAVPLALNPEGNNVGIGTVIPSEKLQVNGTLFVGHDVSSSAGYTTIAGAALRFNRTWTSYIDISSIGQPLYFRTSSASVHDTLAMAILANGNVGIGTTTPAAKLEVNGGIRLNTTTTKPACSNAQRGTIWIDQAAVSSADIMYACMKNSTESYNWVQVAIG